LLTPTFDGMTFYFFFFIYLLRHPFFPVSGVYTIPLGLRGNVSESQSGVNIRSRVLYTTDGDVQSPFLADLSSFEKKSSILLRNLYMVRFPNREIIIIVIKISRKNDQKHITFGAKHITLFIFLLWYTQYYIQAHTNKSRLAISRILHDRCV